MRKETKGVINPAYLVNIKDLHEIEAKAVERGISFVSAGPGPILDAEGCVVVPKGKAYVRFDITLDPDA